MRRKAMAAVNVHPASSNDAARITASGALATFSCLGQATRLAIFRLLMKSEPGGLAAGAIANQLGCPHNTLSAHIAILARSGLVVGIRSGRSIVYRANPEALKALIDYLANEVT
jgi:DNA-binding transcriptional ArsR family regulator